MSSSTDCDSGVSAAPHSGENGRGAQCALCTREVCGRCDALRRRQAKATICKLATKLVVVAVAMLRADTRDRVRNPQHLSVVPDRMRLRSGRGHCTEAVGEDRAGEVTQCQVGRLLAQQREPSEGQQLVGPDGERCRRTTTTTTTDLSQTPKEEPHYHRNSPDRTTNALRPHPHQNPPKRPPPPAHRHVHPREHAKHTTHSPHSHALPYVHRPCRASPG